MNKPQIEIPEIQNDIIITLHLTEDFISMCEFLNVTHKQALDTYLKHIKFYNYLISEDEGTNSEATAIFKKFKDTQFKNEGLHVVKHPKLHLTPIKKILSLVVAEEGSTSPKYVGIIEEWHKIIFKTV